MVLEKTVANYLSEFFKHMDHMSLKIFSRKFIRERGRKRKRIQALLYGVVTYLYTIDRAAREIYGDKYERMSDRKINQIRVYLYRILFQKIYPPEVKKDVLLRPLLKAKMPEKSDNLDEISIKTSFPRWVVEKVVNLVGLKEASDYLSSLNERQSTWIVVNTLVSDDEKVRKKLEIEGVELEEDTEIPHLYRVVSTRKALDKTEPYRFNEFLIMNKASVAVVHALHPRPGEVILDACAAPGMKTLLTSILMNNDGEVYAFDVSESRLHRMKKILKRYGIDIVKASRADASKIELDLNVDKVLIDAPCTSSGMIMESPDIKLRLSPKYISNFSNLQWRIITNILDQIDTHTKVTYSTCSIFPEEGENQIKRLLKEKDVKVEELPFGAPSYMGRNIGSRYFPHRHKTIGMFISNLSKL